MANTCRMCGVSIPDGQSICSMCYGDPDYGKDGLYRDYLNECALQQQREEFEKRHQEEIENG